jgi:hypothetical protein
VTSGVGTGEPSKGGATERISAARPGTWPKAEGPSSLSARSPSADPDGTAHWSPAAEWAGSEEDRTWHQRTLSWEEDQKAGRAGWGVTARSPAQSGPDPVGSPRRPSGHWPELVIVTAVAVIIAAVALAISSANRAAPLHPSGRSAISHGMTTPTPTSSRPRSHTSLSSPSATPASSQTTSTPTPIGGGAIALAVTPAVEQKLVASWLAGNPGNADLAPSDVAGTVPGQVHYGYEPSTATYWAEAAFQPSASVVREASSAAGQVKLEQFQGWLYVFSLRQGPLWTWVGDVEAGSCPNQFVPATVLVAWHLCGYSPNSGLGATRAPKEPGTAGGRVTHGGLDQAGGAAGPGKGQGGAGPGLSGTGRPGAVGPPGGHGGKRPAAGSGSGGPGPAAVPHGR